MTRPGSKVTDEVIFDLVKMSPLEKAAWMSGFECGSLDAINRHQRTHEQAMDDLARRYVGMQLLNEEVDRTLATTIRGVPFDVMADRRGQHKRAEAQRRILRERGIA